MQRVTQLGAALHNATSRADRAERAQRDAAGAAASRAAELETGLVGRGARVDELLAEVGSPFPRCMGFLLEVLQAWEQLLA